MNQLQTLLIRKNHHKWSKGWKLLPGLEKKMAMSRLGAERLDSYKWAESNDLTQWKQAEFPAPLNE